MHKIFNALIHLNFVILLFLTPAANSESVKKFVANEEAIRESMVRISRELGVTCTECHNVNNFKDGSKKTFAISREHMKITDLLKSNGFDGKKGPEATCYMCHRGKLKPDFKEPKSNKAQ